MSSPRRARVTMELELGVEPIRGWLDEDGVPRPFSGWLELSAAIERMRLAPEPRILDDARSPTSADGAE